MDIEQLLRSTRTVLLIDWPDREVPDTLARSGYRVVSHDGPSSDDYNAYEIEQGEVVIRPLGRPPHHAELVYSHRPIEELPEIVEEAVAVGAAAVWIQSGLDAEGTDRRGCWLSAEVSDRARMVVEAAGLAFVEAPYIVDAVRAIR